MLGCLTEKYSNRSRIIIIHLKCTAHKSSAYVYLQQILMEKVGRSYIQYNDKESLLYGGEGG
jgi:hypothetical protein